MNYPTNPLAWLLPLLVAAPCCSGCALLKHWSPRKEATVDRIAAHSELPTDPAVSRASLPQQLNHSQPAVRSVSYDLDQSSGPGVVQTADAFPLSSTSVQSDSSTPMEGGNLMDTIEVSGQPMTLEAFEQMALANNPAIVAANATSSVANGYRYQVGLRPNPTLGYFGSQIADAGTDQHGAFVEQEFVRGNKLALNRQVHSHTLHAQQFEAQVQQYRVLTDVRTRFYLAVAAQRELDVINEFLKVAERGVEVALDRQKAEEASEIEVLQSRTLLSEINLAREQVLASYRGAWNELAAVVGTPELSPMRLEPRFDLPQQSPAWEEAYQTIVAQSPELRVANELVCERRANLTRQQAQPIPNVTTQFGAGYDNGTGQGLINIQVGAPIPVFNKNSGNIAAAYADYTRALENVRRIELEIKSRLARSAQDFESAFAAVQKYQYEIIPQADETLQLSEQAYTAGELDFLQVLVVRRVYFNSTVQLIRAQAQLAQANARINGLLLEGGLNAPEDYTSDDGLRGQSLGGQ